MKSEGNMESIINNKTDNYKQLLYISKQLLLEGSDLSIIANMYHLSTGEFFDLFSYYIKNSDMKGYKIVTTEGDNIAKTKELSVQLPQYQLFREEIYKFAYLRCSNIGNTKFSCWAADCDRLSTTMEISNELTNKGIYHAIYSSARGGYNIKQSNVSISPEELTKQYQLLMK